MNIDSGYLADDEAETTDEYFKDGKVYKLTSSQTDKIYIGSTFQTLKDRNRVHRCRKSNNTVSYLITDYDDFKIVLLEKLNFATKKQLEEVEAMYIRRHRDICVNKKIPLRTKKQYYLDNRVSIGIKNKKYRIAHRPAILIKQKEYRIKNKQKLNNFDLIRYHYIKSWGGNPPYNNNLLKISLDLFI